VGDQIGVKDEMTDTEYPDWLCEMKKEEEQLRAQIKRKPDLKLIKYWVKFVQDVAFAEAEFEIRRDNLERLNRRRKMIIDR
jgi:hypothetical protein